MSRRPKNRLLQRLEYFVYRLVASRARKASDEALYRWGARLGSFTRLFARRRTRIAVENFRASFHERADEAETVIRECWRHMGREALATIKKQELSPAEIAATCDFIGIELVREAMARGGGVILVTAHYGSWETAGLAIALHVEHLRYRGCLAAIGGDLGQKIRDAAFVLEAVLQRAVGRESEDVVTHPIEADYDCLTRHLMLRCASPSQSLSSDRASTTRAPGAPRCGEKERR